METPQKTEAKRLRDRDDGAPPVGRQAPRRVPLPSLRLRVSERRLLLLLVDLLLVNLALILALTIRTDFVFTWENVRTFYYLWFLILSLVWLLSALFFNVYDLARAASIIHSVRDAGVAALVTVGIYLLTPFFTPPLQSRSLIVLFGAMAVSGIMAWRALYARLFVQPWFKQRALVVGAGWAGRTLAEALSVVPSDAANPLRGTGYRLVGFIDDNPEYVGKVIAGVPILGGRDEVVALAQELEVDEIVLAITHRHAIAPELFDALLRCRELGFRLTTMSVLYERLLGRVPVDHVGRDLQMVVPMEDSAIERFNLMLKRGIDLLLGSIGVIVLILVAPLVALVNVLTSPGPLFYRQERVGRGGSTFDMIKFRSMRPDAEEETGAIWACTGDVRITPVGRFLRNTRLDELPQFINVLKGEMSVVGPRPERPEFVEKLADELPFYRARHAVKPGITGWAQVQYRYGSSVEDAQVKLEYDLYYVKYAGPYLDLRIVLQTIPVMLRFGGQ